MLKIFRRYNKWFLAILMAFLMVTWLISGSSSFLRGDPRKAVEFTLTGGEKVRAGDLFKSTGEYGAMKDLVPALINGMGIKDGVHWHLLVHEAQAQKLVGNAMDGESWLPELSRAILPLELRRAELEKYRESSPQTYRFLLEQPQFLDSLIQNRLRDPAALEETRKQVEMNLRDGRAIVGNRNRMNIEEVNLALAKLRGVARMLGAYQTAPRLSDARTLLLARDRFDSVLASAVVIPAEAFVDPALTPSEDELNAHFQEYRDSEPGSGEFGFGYVLPERFKLEWFKIDRSTVAASVSVDPVEANLYWRENRARFPGEFAAERERIVEALRQRRVTDAMNDAERAYKAALRASTRSLDSDGGVKRLPQGWRAPSMIDLARAVADGVSTSQKISIAPPPVESRGGEWVRLSEVSMLPGIGGASYNIGNKSLEFVELLAQTHELGSKMDLGLQVGVPFENVLSDSVGNRYCFVVLDAQKPGPAPTLNDARADVIRDVRLLRAYEDLLARMPEYQLVAASDGLEELAKRVNAEKRDASRAIGVLHDQRYTRVQSPPASMDDEAGTLRTALLEHADVLGALTPATDENRPLRTLAVPIPKTRHVVIAQIGGFEPVTVQTMRTINSRVADMLVREEVNAVATGDGPYSLEGLKKRLGYQAAGDKSTRSPKPNNAS